MLMKWGLFGQAKTLRPFARSERIGSKSPELERKVPHKVPHCSPPVRAPAKEATNPANPADASPSWIMVAALSTHRLPGRTRGYQTLSERLQWLMKKASKESCSGRIACMRPSTTTAFLGA